MDGKQVAVLVPTTVLAQQHHAHLRASGSRAFPVDVECRSAASARADEQKRDRARASRTAAWTSSIGTHRLLSEDVQFKDLGLVIIDEEQRFGVEHKERLKQLRTKVDVLTLTRHADPAHAAPGARRHPRHEHDRDPAGGSAADADLRRAVDDEAQVRAGDPARAGPRGAGLLRPQPGPDHRAGTADRLPSSVPEARFVVGHGQMAEHELEQVMVDF